MGIMFSAFSWTYVAMQVPGGLFLDRFGSKITYYWSMTLVVCTFLQGFVPGVATLLACRLGLGVTEAPCFPTNSRVVATWFPQNERAMATGTYTVGEYIGLAFFSPVLFALMGAFGWRSLFWVVGAVGIVFGLLVEVLSRAAQPSGCELGGAGLYRGGRRSRTRCAQERRQGRQAGAGQVQLVDGRQTGEEAPARGHLPRPVRRQLDARVPGSRPTSPPNATWAG